MGLKKGEEEKKSIIIKTNSSKFWCTEEKEGEERGGRSWRGF